MVSEDADRNTTTHPFRRQQDVGTETDRVHPEVQRTFCPLGGHVCTNPGIQTTTNNSGGHVCTNISADVIMAQMDTNGLNDGLTILDQKRKRTESPGPSDEPTPIFIDLNGPTIISKNLLGAGPATQARPEQ